MDQPVNQHGISEAAQGTAEREAAEMATRWICFHCGFETSDLREAEAHFGERDDAEEFRPLCRWWSKLSQEDRADAFQDLQQQLNAERDDNARLTVRIEGLEYQQTEVGHYFKGCRSITEAWHKFDSMEGRALAAEEQLESLRIRLSLEPDGDVSEALDSLIAENDELREELAKLKGAVRPFVDAQFGKCSPPTTKQWKLLAEVAGAADPTIQSLVHPVEPKNGSQGDQI